MVMCHSIEPPDNPFWNFSLQFYSKEGVADILLWFQEACEVDINLMLYCCWAGVSQTPGLRATDVTFLREIVGRWQSEIIQPLRCLRQTLKTDARGAPVSRVAGVRAIIQQAELEAERLQQDMLHTNAPREVNETLDESEGRQHTISNLVLYLTQESEQLDTIRMGKVTALVDALFDPQNKNIYANSS